MWFWSKIVFNYAIFLLQSSILSEAALFFESTSCAKPLIFF